MAMRAARRLGLSRPDNVGPAERLLSLMAGLGLTLAALGRGSVVRRAALGLAGLSLVSRGATAYCPAKAALTGHTSLGTGLREQWDRLTARLGTEATRIDSLESMYLAELQELHSAEAQLARLMEQLSQTVGHESLGRNLHDYATEAGARRDELARLLQGRGLDPWGHPDQAMQALVHETWKMAQVSGGNVRDAALVASLQRLLHHMIAGYGTVAAYAKQLDRPEDAARFAEWTDRCQDVDEELTEIAKSTLNPDARLAPEAHGRAAEAARPH